MSPGLVEYAKRVSAIAGAILASLALLGAIWAAAVSLTIAPMIQSLVSEERLARADADKDLARRMGEIADTQGQLSKDRVVVLRILEANSLAGRNYRIRLARETWADPLPKLREH